MSQLEKRLDAWVERQLKKAGIDAHAQGAGMPEMAAALNAASKNGTGMYGRPEFTAVVDGFALIVEDKASIAMLEKLDENGEPDLSLSAVQRYAVNGALHYALCIAESGQFKRVFACAAAGTGPRRLKAIYVNGDRGWKDLGEIKDFRLFSPSCIRQAIPDESALHDFPVRPTMEEPADSQVNSGLLFLPPKKIKPIMISVTMRLSPDIKKAAGKLARERGMSLSEFCAAVMQNVVSVATSSEKNACVV